MTDDDAIRQCDPLDLDHTPYDAASAVLASDCSR